MPLYCFKVGLLSFLLLAMTTSSALACMCWVGNAETTDEERIRVAREVVRETDFVIVGRIKSIKNNNVKSGSSSSSQDENYKSNYIAVIKVESTLKGEPSDRIVIARRAAQNDGHALGSCPKFWKENERSLWLVHTGEDGKMILRTGCAHSHVYEWLYPDFVHFECG